MSRSRVLITGSTEGLGMMAAKLLANEGHAVTLHARNEARAHDARAALPAAEGILIGDLSSLAGIRRVAEQANLAGPFDAVIHNAGVGYREPRIETADGLEHVFAVNVLAPYLLTALVTPPRRPRVLELRDAPRRRGRSRRHAVDEAQVEREPGLCGQQAVRRRARLRGRAPMAWRALECARARLGADAHGRPRRTRRPIARGRDAGVARRE